MEKILQGETQTELEHEIIKHHTKGYEPKGNVIQKDGMFQITVVKQ